MGHFCGGSSFGTAASCTCRVVGLIHLSNAGRGWGELHDRAADQQQPLRFKAPRHAQKFRPVDLPPQPTSCAAVGASQAAMDAAPDSYLRAPCAPQQMMTQGLDRPAAPIQPAAAPAPCTRRHVVCHGTFPAAEAALGLQPAAPAVSSGSSSVRCRERAEGISRSSSRSSGNRCDSSRCTVHSSSARPIYLRNGRVMQR